MAGTKEGAQQAAQTNKSIYGPDFYVVLGRKGGAASNTGGFYVNRELARQAGALGGAISRRGKKLSPTERAKIKARYYKQYEQNLARLTKVHEAAMAKRGTQE